MQTKPVYKLSLIMAAMAFFLTGCATGVDIPDTIDSNYNASESQQKIIDRWVSEEPTVIYVDRGGPLTIDSPNKIPLDLLDKSIEVVFAKDVELSDLSAFLNSLGLFVIIPEPELAAKKITLFAFKGTLGDYLSALSVSYQISFNWNEGGIMTVESKSTYMIRIPQDEDLMKSLVGDIGKLGAENILASVYSGLITYEAGSNAHQKIIKYLERATINAAMITTQVAIITVQLNKERNVGIDWNELGLTLGNQKILETDDDSSTSPDTGKDNNNDSGNVKTGSGESSSGGTSAKDVISALGTNLRDTTGAGNLSGTGSAFKVAKGDFTLSAAINYLSLYGETETEQSVLMKTLSGKEVSLKSGQKIPYVDSVGVSTGSNSSSVDSNSLGSVDIKEIDVGLELKLKPFYENQSKIVTTEVELKLSSLLGFIELSAGKQVGTVTRPNTQEQEFNDVVKVTAGESVLIGGITYTSRSDKRNAPAFLEKAGVSASNVEMSKNAMFIMLRPSVTVFGDFPDLPKKD